VKKKAKRGEVLSGGNELHWTQKKPTKKGRYLRVNAGHSVCFEHLIRGAPWSDRVLRVSWGWGGDKAWIPVSQVRGEWWWYGPIPEPPKEAL